MRWIIQSFFERVWKSTYFPFSRSPWKVTITSFGCHFSSSYVPVSHSFTVPAP